MYDFKSDPRFAGITPFQNKVWNERYNWGNQEKTLIFQGL